MTERAGNLEISIQPGSRRYEPHDDAWRAQQVALRQALRNADVAEVRREETAAPGQKGGWEELVVVLASSGSITAALQTVRAWLARDRDRTMNVTFNDGEREVTMTVEGTATSADAVATAMTSALEHLPGK